MRRVRGAAPVLGIVLLLAACDASEAPPRRARPLSIEGSRVLGQLARLHEEKRYDDGIRLARTFLAQEPDSPMIHYALGGLLGSKQDHVGAIEAFERELEVNPSHPGTLRGLGVAYTRLGRLEESLDPLRRALAHEPQAADLAYQLGRNLSALGEFEEAEGHLRRAGEAGEADGWAELGVLYRRLRREADAVEPFQRALSLESEHLRALMQLGQIVSRTGDPELGRAVLARHAELAVAQDRYDNAEASTRLPNPTAEPFRRLALEQWRRGDIEDALGNLRRARSRAPGDVELARLLVRCHLAAGDAAGAMPWAVEQLLADPEGPRGHFVLALTRIAAGETESARHALAESRRRGSWSRAERLELAEAWRRGFEPEAALAVLAEVDDGADRDSARALALAQMERWREASDALALSAYEKDAGAGPLEILAIAASHAGDESAAARALAAAAERRRVDLVTGGQERLVEAFSELPGGVGVVAAYRAALSAATPSFPGLDGAGGPGRR